MNEKIRQIIDQINTLEEELDKAIDETESRMSYQIQGRRVAFEQAVKDGHRRVKMGVFRWFLTVRPQNYFTAPIIYGMVVPFAFLDLLITIYQWTCFPVYGVKRVKRGNYIVMDHRHLAYLNIVEKVHCMYCSYGVGLLAYASEITARTEQYFCPIKHAHKVIGAHSRYANFLGYGEADNYHRKLEKFRGELAREKADSANK